MKIGVTSTGKDMDANVDPRLGRCSYFIVVDSETMEFEAISNESAAAAGGAGIQTAQMMARTGVEVVITGNAGPNAFQTLQAAGIKVITGASGSVREAVEKYMSGELKEIDEANVGSHAGMGGGGGGNRSDGGMGGGKGMGGGHGRMR